jgi:hypothetical protein
MRAALDTASSDLEVGDFDTAIVLHATTCITDALNGGTYSMALNGGQGQLLIDLATAIDVEFAKIKKQYQDLLVANEKILNTIHDFDAKTVETVSKLVEAQNIAMYKALDAHTLLVSQMIEIYTNNNTGANPAKTETQRRVENIERIIIMDRRFLWIGFGFIWITFGVYAFFDIAYKYIK